MEDSSRLFIKIFRIPKRNSSWRFLILVKNTFFKSKQLNSQFSVRHGYIQDELKLINTLFDMLLLKYFFKYFFICWEMLSYFDYSSSNLYQ